MKLKNQNDKTLWFKFGESVMEHVVIFVCIWMQLQTVFCQQSYLRHDFYNSFLKSNIKHT